MNKIIVLIAAAALAAGVFYFQNLALTVCRGKYEQLQKQMQVCKENTKVKSFESWSKEFIKGGKVEKKEINVSGGTHSLNI